jgi:hypothetical protein
MDSKEWPLLRRILFWVTSLSFGFLVLTTTALSNQQYGNIINIVVMIITCVLSLAYCFLFGKIKIDVFCFSIVLFNFWTIVCYLANGCFSFRSSALTVGLSSIFLYEFLSQGEKERNCALHFVLFGTWAFCIIYLVVYRYEVFHPDFSTRIGDQFGNLNDTARFLAYSLLFNFYFITSKKYKYIIPIPFVVLFGYFILLTGSISNLLTVFFVFLVCGFYLTKRHKRWIFVVAVLTLVVGFVLLLQLDAFSYFKTRVLGIFEVLFGINVGEYDYSTRNRFILASECFALLLQKPIFGFGFNAGLENTSFGGFAHNNLAEVGADFGLPGLLLFEAIILLPFFISKKQKNNESLYFSLVLMSFTLLFQPFLVSYYSKMEYIVFAFAYSACCFSNSLDIYVLKKDRLYSCCFDVHIYRHKKLKRYYLNKK